MTAATPTARGRALLIGHGAPAIALLAYLVLGLLYLHLPLASYLALIRGWGAPVGDPLDDFESVLIAIDCARQGVDVTLPNACMGGGLYQYSPLVLKLAALKVDHGQFVPLALGMDGLFLLSVFALPRPRRWIEFWQLLLAALSSSVLWALESANIDLAIYLLALAGLYLLCRGAGARLLGYALVLGVAAVKFYPACLLLLAVRERPGRFLAIALVSLAAALLLIAAFSTGLGQVMVRLPRGSPFNGMFSADDIPLVLGAIADDLGAPSGIARAVRIGAMLVPLCGCAALVWSWVPTILPRVRTLPPRERTLLVAGSVVIAFCFLAAQNNYYRAIFLFPTLAGLWALERGAGTRADANRFRFASWLAVALLWSATFWVGPDMLLDPWLGKYGKRPFLLLIWAVRELLWWWLVGLLVSIVLCFVWDAPILARLRARQRATA
jgi:hypothetical protein